MKTPIFFGSTELESIAYGIDKMLPQAIPIQINEKISVFACGTKYMLKNPTPPQIKENI
tara:strand:+ start:444 stop:620 length:177 start_codon:yes stop_codon:yes gene_type:complete